jgi:3-phenylpropionate/trans-cinnamate dioxygenase ferredoxin component
MARFVTVAKANSIQPGQVLKVEIDNFPVAVANVGGTFHAFDDTCTHEDCSLADGDLEQHKIICPCHFAEFDVRNGAVLTPPATVPLKVYPVRVQGTDLQVEF